MLAVPRTVSFYDLAARLSFEKVGGAKVRTIRHQLTDCVEVHKYDLKRL